MARLRQHSALLVAALILAGVGSGCSDPAGGKESAHPPGPPPVPVVVGTAVEKPMPTQIRAIGTVQAISIIQVKPQISGQLMTVHFREGQDVQKGDLLFTIDRRPLQAALQQAEANLGQAQAQLRQAEAAVVRDRAQLENARVEDRRYAKLAEQGYVAREQADQIHTSLEAMAATVDADQAAVENARAFILADQAAVESARLQLEYTEVHSPIDGRTGNLMVQPGNLVKANDVPVLVTIAQTRPIYVAFGVPERSLPDIRQHMAAGPLEVEVQPPGRRRGDGPRPGDLRRQRGRRHDRHDPAEGDGAEHRRRAVAGTVRERHPHPDDRSARGRRAGPGRSDRPERPVRVRGEVG